MPSTRLNAKKHRAGEAGFSVAEAIVSAGLLTVSSVALISVFTSSVESVKNINSRDAISAAINADLAKTQRLNDYYTCVAEVAAWLILTNRLLINTNMPPALADDPAAFATFTSLCKNTSNQPFAGPCG